jgi:hypothetical protein
MPKQKANPIKEPIQESLPILAGISSVLETCSENDVRMYLGLGARLIGVAKIDNAQDGRPFHYSLGWPASAGSPPQSW